MNLRDTSTRHDKEHDDWKTRIFLGMRAWVRETMTIRAREDKASWARHDYMMAWACDNMKMWVLYETVSVGEREPMRPWRLEREVTWCLSSSWWHGDVSMWRHGDVSMRRCVYESMRMWGRPWGCDNVKGIWRYESKSVSPWYHYDVRSRRHGPCACCDDMVTQARDDMRMWVHENVSIRERESVKTWVCEGASM
jgi:hypothetical protein